MRQLACRNGHDHTGLGVASHLGLAVFQAEGAKSSLFDPFTLADRITHGGQKRIDNGGSLQLGQTRTFGNDVDQISLIHHKPPIHSPKLI